MIHAGWIYQDSEGTLMIPTDDFDTAEEGTYFVFAAAGLVRGDNNLIAWPLSPVFNDKCENLGDDLKYPNKTAWRD